MPAGISCPESPARCGRQGRRLGPVGQTRPFFSLQPPSRWSPRNDHDGSAEGRPVGARREPYIFRPATFGTSRERLAVCGYRL